MKKPQKAVYQIESNAEKNYQIAFSLFFYLCCLIAFLAFTFSTQYLDVQVNGPSMKPTINKEWSSPDFINKRDTVYINFKTPYHKGDIIVIEHSDFIIKRLIAISGDRVNIIKNELEEVEVYVNNELLIEDYVVYKHGLETTYNNFENLKEIKPELFENQELVVPQNYVFYLGDNRGQSQDCSVYGPVSEEKVIGKVNIIVPYGKNFVTVMFESVWGYIVKMF